LEFKVPFQHKYGYIRDDFIPRNNAVVLQYLLVLDTLRVELQ